MPFATKRFGPFQAGVTDAANPLLLDGQPALRFARNAVLDGMGRLIARFGTTVALTLMDDQGSPAPVTGVCQVTPFADGALAVGWSSITQKCYLYWLKDDLTNWYNANKVLQNTLTPAPVAVLWSGVTTVPDITIAEGLNVAYIAHYFPGTSFQTRQFDTTVSPAVLGDYQANLDGTGLKQTFFRGVVSFKQHLWGWGYGSQAVNDGFRPELIRFSTPFFAPMAQSDNFAVGNRTRSVRESIVLAIVAGEALYIGTNFSIWPVTGFGRNSWDKSRPADDSYGIAGPHAAVAGPNGVLYYWSHRGLLRIQGYGPPEPLWPRIAQVIRGVVNDIFVCLAYDQSTDQVLVFYQDQTSGIISRLCAYDTIRNVFLGPDGDVGISVGCAGLVTPGLVNVPTGLPGPAGPPTGASTVAIGSTVATAEWADGDLSPDCLAQIEHRAAPGVFGVATGGSSTTLVDTAQAWTPNQWAGQQVTVVSGTGAVESRTILSNTATTLTISVGTDGQAWTAPDATSHYAILPQTIGAVSSATPTTLTDATAGWTINQFAGQKVRIVSGLGVAQEKVIISNTGTTLTISTGSDGLQWAQVPDSTARYRIVGLVTAATSTTITDSSRSFAANGLVGQTVLILAGTGQGQLRTVVSNTATQITISNGTDGLGWATTPDATSQYQLVAGPAWIVDSSVIHVSATNSYQLSGLSKNTQYQWRVKDVRNGISSIYLVSPVFLTTNQLNPPTNPSAGGWQQDFQDGTFVAGASVAWMNSGEAGVQTEVYMLGPSVTDPGQAAIAQPGNLQATQPAGSASWSSPALDTSTRDGGSGPGAGNYWFVMRHVRSGAIPSAYTSPDVFSQVA